jgi:hypothetical protein
VRGVRGPAASRSGPDQARTAHQTPVPATAQSGPTERSSPAVLPVHPGPILHALKAHPTTAQPRQSPIPAQPPAPREKQARDGSPASAAKANPLRARVPNQSPEVPPNRATELNPAAPNAPDPVPAESPAERSADKISPTANRGGASSCSP